MSQNIILRNFQRFLYLSAKEVQAEFLIQVKELTDQQSILQLINKKNRSLRYIKQLRKKLNSGYCYGFALCHGAMDVLGKLNWWEHVLKEVNNWDKKKRSLREKILIPGSNENKEITRKKLIQLAMNYIIYHQAEFGRLYKKIFPIRLNQTSILKPTYRQNSKQIQQQLNFEMLNDNGEILTVRKRKYMCGYFTKKSLRMLLQKKSIQDTVTLILSADHAIRIGHNGVNWLFYDSNNLHEKSEFIHTEFACKRQLIAKIFSCLNTHSFCVEVATFNAAKNLNFSVYTQFIKRFPLIPIKGKGLHFIVEHDKKLLKTVFDHANDTPTGKKIKSAIAKAICRTTEDGDTLIHYLIKYSPNYLFKLLELVNQTKEGVAILTAITKALAIKNKEHWYGLHDMARFVPDALLRLFLSIDTTPEGTALFETMMRLLPVKGKNDWNVLHHLVFVAPGHFFELLMLADKIPQASVLRATICKAMIGLEERDWTPLHVMAHAGMSFNELIAFANGHPESLQLMLIISTGLTMKNNNKWTPLNLCACYSPHVLTELFNAIDHTDNSLALRAAIACSLIDMENSDLSILHHIVLEDATCLLGLVSMINNTTMGNILRFALAKALTIRSITDDSTALLYLVRHAEFYTLLIVNAVFKKNSSNYKKLCFVIEAFIGANIHGRTAWQMLMQQSKSIAEGVLEILFKELAKLNQIQLLSIKNKLPITLFTSKIAYPNFFKETSSSSLTSKILSEIKCILAKRRVNMVDNDNELRAINIKRNW